MSTLAVATAVALVRKNLDETLENGSVMYDDQAGDNQSLDNIIKRSLPEAINAVHLMAPAEVLDWDAALTPVTNCSMDLDDTKKVVTFELSASNNYLRLVAFKAVDTDYVVSSVIDSASPEGRKQLNPYIRGQWDRPRLVQHHGQVNNGNPKFSYYSLKEELDSDDSSVIAGMIDYVRIIRRQDYSSIALQYTIAYRCQQNIIDYLTGLVMTIFSDQRAQVFFEKAKNFQPY